ncbi:MAG: hypothetical protein KF888_12185 [Nitrosomonas sp.]|nr:hypothetical protein [Nitrosomonas sp.]
MTSISGGKSLFKYIETMIRPTPESIVVTINRQWLYAFPKKLIVFVFLKFKRISADKPVKNITAPTAIMTGTIGFTVSLLPEYLIYRLVIV